jgi:hypothetical protein
MEISKTQPRNVYEKTDTFQKISTILIPEKLPQNLTTLLYIAKYNMTSIPHIRQTSNEWSNGNSFLVADEELSGSQVSQLYCCKLAKPLSHRLFIISTRAEI